MEAGEQQACMIGCAGWSIPGAEAARFPGAGTHLERYAAILPAVEINSSFYRPHRPATYARWRDSVPEDFRFSVKMPKEISHLRKLAGCEEPLERFLAECGELRQKLGCLLLQLPPGLAFDPVVAAAFLRLLRTGCGADVVCEPRHASWFGAEAAALLEEHGIAYVDADPPVRPLPTPQARPARLAYLRLHGSPRIYYSPYADGFITALGARVRQLQGAGMRVWCVFDNTAAGAAVPNALSLLAEVAPPPPAHRRP